MVTRRTLLGRMLGGLAAVLGGSKLLKAYDHVEVTSTQGYWRVEQQSLRKRTVSSLLPPSPEGPILPESPLRHLPDFIEMPGVVMDLWTCKDTHGKERVFALCNVPITLSGVLPSSYTQALSYEICEDGTVKPGCLRVGKYGPTPDMRMLNRMYREGPPLSASRFDWYTDRNIVQLAPLPKAPTYRIIDAQIDGRQASAEQLERLNCQIAVEEGQKALERSSAAKGVFKTWRTEDGDVVCVDQRASCRVSKG